MIESIELTNWKAFDHLELDFSRGVNFIIGPNGTGKTSILEAICLAFTGETLTADYKQLVRGQRDNANIILKFRFNNAETYTIERNFSRQRRGAARLLDSKGNPKANNWDEVTKFIENLYGIHSLFFQRVIYMSEGDVHRFIDKPPGEALMSQIDSILGVDQMKYISNELDQLENDFKEDEERYKKMLKDLEKTLKVTVINIDNLLADIKALEKEKERLSKQLNEIDNDIWNKEKMLREKERLKIELLEIKEEIKNLVDLSQFEVNMIVELSKSIEIISKKYVGLEENIAERTSYKNKIEGQMESLSKVLDLISIVDEERDKVIEIRCPVCKKLLTEHEVSTIRKETTNEIDSIKRKIDYLKKEIDELKRSKEPIRRDLDLLKNRRVRLQTLIKEDKGARIIERIGDELKLLSNKLNALQSDKHRVELLLKDKEEKIKNLSEEIGKVRPVMESRELENIDYLLISATKGEIISQVFKQAIHSTIREQREKQLAGIYDEMSYALNKFKSDGDWVVKINEKGVPLIERADQKYDLEQLSGGEKTALLVITRTILCRHFAKSNFMLLDEPLEHLDPKNRRSLINFLVESYGKGLIDQLIITTFEESLVRKYLDNETTKIIPLMTKVIFGEILA